MPNNFVTRTKKQLFPKGIRPSLKKHGSRVFNRTTRKQLCQAFKQLGIPERPVVCIHAMLSGLGYIVGGAQTVIHALFDAVPDLTLMMPTFPFSGSALDYINSGTIYDPKSTPSKSGLLSEILRLSPGALRSLHPTHPCVALGPAAREIIDKSELSQTPFGDASTYGRYSNRSDAILLLIHTNNTSIVHRIQEMVNMPNLFLDGIFCIRGLNHNGDIVNHSLRIHNSLIPLFLVFPGKQSDEIIYLWYPDYAILFPEYNRARILRGLGNSSIAEYLVQRDEDFRGQGIITTVRLGNAEIAAVRVSPWLERLCSDIGRNISVFSSSYDTATMEMALKKGMLKKFE